MNARPVAVALLLLVPPDFLAAAPEPPEGTQMPEGTADVGTGWKMVRALLEDP